VWATVAIWNLQRQTKIPKRRVAHPFFDAELTQASIAHTLTRYRPQTNGKVECYNRTLLNKWAYARPYRSEAARTRALAQWLHMYNHHWHHTAIIGPPISRLNNVAGQPERAPRVC